VSSVTNISSPSNATIRGIRALRGRRAREATGRFWVEGIRLVGEAVELAADRGVGLLIGLDGEVACPAIGGRKVLGVG